MKKKREWIFPAACLCCALWGSAFPCVKIGYQLFAIDSSDTAAILLFAGARFFLAGVLVVLAGSFLAIVEERKGDPGEIGTGQDSMARESMDRDFVAQNSGNRDSRNRNSTDQSFEAKLSELSGPQKKFSHFLKPAKDSWKYILCIALFQTLLQYLFFYIGLAHTSGVKSSIVQSVSVFVTIVISVWVFRLEKMTRKKVIGCIVGIAGVILVNFQAGTLDTGVTLFGEGYIFLSTVAYAVSVSLMKIFSEKESAVVLSGYQFAVGGLVMVLIGLAMGGRFGAVTVSGCLMLGYLALVSAVAYTLWGILLKKYELSRVAVYGFLTPVFGAVLSTVFLGDGELLKAKNVVALLLVCAGIWIVNGNFEKLGRGDT